jgi:hypothetical protein
MRRYLRLGLLLLLTAVPWMWWFGDYNLYLGQGSEREFKALPTPAERLIGSLCLGALYSVIVLVLFGAVESATTEFADSADSRSERETAEPDAPPDRGGMSAIRNPKLPEPPRQ